MKRILFLLGVVMGISACDQDRFDLAVEIPDFDFAETVVFKDSLSSYNIFQGSPSDLLPTADFHLLELNAVLFTDYAYKQRLIHVPDGFQVGKEADGTLDFPNGTLLTKTFYYYLDERSPELGKRIIETRLLIKQNDAWNLATYIWNEEQTEATLELDGLDTSVSWINKDGKNISTLYHVPTQNECMACHQTDLTLTPIGPKLRNLNRTVERSGDAVHQIEYLQSLNILSDFDHNQIPLLPDYKNSQVNIADRARAYLEINCAHCHNPQAWEAPAERDFDFRYETAFSDTGIRFETEKISDALLEMDMPFIGTSLLDEEGVNLLLEYFDGL